MDHEGYLELLALSLDRELTEEEKQALTEHLANSPASRGVGAQLAALQESFKELEEFPAPEGFAQSVMQRVRESEQKKTIPLFQRPRFRALAGLAACAVLAVGLYGAAQPRKNGEEDFRMITRSMTQDTVEETAACESLPASREEVPQIAAYSAPEEAGTLAGEQTDSPGCAPEYSAESQEKTSSDSIADSAWEDWPQADFVLTLDRLPEGAAELIPPETAVTCDLETGAEIYYWLTWEQLAAIEQLACEQGLLPGPSESEPLPEQCALIVRNK